MPIKQLKSARLTAMLLVINSSLYSKEREREVTRYRFSHQTLCRISGGRKNIRGAFIKELDDELLELNWKLISIASEYAIVNLANTDSWVKLSAKRLVDSAYLVLAESEVEKVYEALFPESQEEDE